jgi:hypothetical protein
MFALVGTLLNFVVIGSLVFGVSALGWTYRLTIVESMVYGALFSATDTGMSDEKEKINSALP